MDVAPKGKTTLIPRNYDYLKEKKSKEAEYHGDVECTKRFKCKARLVTADDQMVSAIQMEHTQFGNFFDSKESHRGNEAIL